MSISKTLSRHKQFTIRYILHRILFLFCTISFFIYFLLEGPNLHVTPWSANRIHNWFLIRKSTVQIAVLLRVRKLLSTCFIHAKSCENLQWYVTRFIMQYCNKCLHFFMDYQFQFQLYPLVWLLLQFWALNESQLHYSIKSFCPTYIFR